MAIKLVLTIFCVMGAVAGQFGFGGYGGMGGFGNNNYGYGSPYNTGYGGGYGGLGNFGGFGSGFGQGNALGGGSAQLGSVMTNNGALSRSSPWGGMSTAQNSAAGQGYGVNIWGAATGNSGYNRGF
ncbi:shematrin-like protein 2 [Paramacrobiotus metropolitanus]|uniref:shematrin-like protein 2 n=1 Tax=Paramacrobiotus metropolitanus TaxID=2943436 RepID=UPI0024464376|nr:shematrin-like protein 2 [Paramacrobiotus metropolitanus]